MENQPKFVQTLYSYAEMGLAQAQEWLLSPAAWSQFALLLAAWVLAIVVNRPATTALSRVLTAQTEREARFSALYRFVLVLLPLLLPLIAYAFTALGESFTRSIFGSGAVIGFGKRLFLFIAARVLVRDILSVPFLKVLGRYLLLPIMALHVVGLLVPISGMLSETVIQLGNISFSVMSIIRGVAAGSLLFWLGQWSAAQSSDYISEQKAMRPSTRELAAKAAEWSIFGAAFLILISVMGIDLTALAVLGGAIGVGLGFGLQKIAANFISGVILLLEGQATVGDFVELDGGEAGTIVKMTARATVLETFDGRWIVVPNEDFITTRVVNFSDSGSANRYEVAFSVSYDTDINLVPAIVETAVSTHPGVLEKPYPPDCELRGFGDSGVDFAVEIWVNGFDDGPNKFTSDVLFLIWNALKDNGIEIPYPHRVVEIKGSRQTPIVNA